MSQATLRQAIVSAVETVPNVGVVYDKHRYSNRMDSYLDLFKTTIDGTPQIRAWQVSYSNMESNSLAIRTATQRIYTFTITGYLGVDDSADTENTFADLTEAVCNALDNDSAIHAAQTHVDFAQVTTFGYIRFGDVLCHSAEIECRVREAFNASYV